MTTRREFLQSSALATAALAGLTACGGSKNRSDATPVPTEPPSAIPAAPILVMINIDGGWDWLSALFPNAGANLSPYMAARPTLSTGLLGTDMGGGYALNNDLLGMVELSQKGRVFWMPGIGMPNFSLSHFTAGDLWGQGATVPAGTGWLGRFADTAFSPSGDVLRGITVTSDRPLMVKGATRSFVSISNGSGFVYPSYLRSNKVGSPYDATILENGWGASLAAPAPAGLSATAYQAALTSGKAFYDAQNDPAFGSNNQLPARTPSVLYPGDTGYTTPGLSRSLSNQLKLIAQMIASGLPGQIYYARLGGWDTHSNQAADFPRLLGALGGSLRAFYDDLATITTSQGNAQDRVMIMGFSEFGRRVKENDGGTDHGTAGLAFCMGKAVKGGLLDSYPTLGSLDPNGNMKYNASADYRSLYATVLDRWLGQATTTTNTLLGASYPRFGFL